VIDKEQLLALVQRHLRIPHLYPASFFWGNGWNRQNYNKNHAVMMVRKREEYYDCMIWNNVGVWLEDRPDCDTRIWVTKYGEIMVKPSAGRRKVPQNKRTKKIYVGVLQHIYELWERSPNILSLKPTTATRAAISEWSYKWALRQAKQDYGICSRKLYDHDRVHGGWVICYSDGEQITKNPRQYEWEAWSHAYNSMVHGIVEPLLLDG